MTLHFIPLEEGSPEHNTVQKIGGKHVFNEISQISPIIFNVKSNIVIQKSRSKQTKQTSHVNKRSWRQNTRKNMFSNQDFPETYFLQYRHCKAHFFQSIFEKTWFEAVPKPQFERNVWSDELLEECNSKKKMCLTKYVGEARIVTFKYCQIDSKRQETWDVDQSKDSHMLQQRLLSCKFF